MGKTGLRTLISVIVILIFSLLIFLLIDDNFLKNKYFNNISKNYSLFINNIFGTFSYFILGIGFFLGLIFALNIKIVPKIFIFLGSVLLSSFLLSFFENYKIIEITGGLAGIKIKSLMPDVNSILQGTIYFFWFFTSLFLLFFPVKDVISTIIYKLIILLFGKNKNDIQDKKSKFNSSIKRDSKVFYDYNLRKKSNSMKNIPWVSKVIYENTSNRIEIPVFPDKNEPMKKFKLQKNTNGKTQNFNEVSTFSEKKEIHTGVDNDEYFSKIKTNWPDHWKENFYIEDNVDQYNEEYDIDKVMNFQNDQIEEINTKTYLIENENSLDNKIVDVEIIDEKEDVNQLIDNKEIDIEAVLNKNFKLNNYISQNIDNNTEENFILPDCDILEHEEIKNYANQFKAEEKEAAHILEETLLEFGIKAEVCEIIHGPVVTLFKLIPAPGVKLSRIESLSTNLALRLAAQSIRIIAPIPGEKVVGIEIPNKKRELVSFKEVVNSEVFIESKFNIPIGLGKDIYGKIIVVDLYKMPHILIAGATGAGKSVCVNSFISSILFSKTPEELRLILIDPKIVELKPYNNIPHLLTPVITESKEAMNALKYLLFEMERRYSLLDQMGVRDIVEYRKMHIKKTHLEDLPFIVAFVDEFADLMTTSGKEAEILFARLAAKARAVGILLVLATQRPSADVITGLIKANIPARIAFQVISLQDSRIILDQKGAEKLLGQGDMLYLGPTQPFPIRIQGAFLSKEEVDSIADHWKNVATPKYIDIKEFIHDEEECEVSYDGESKDPLFDQAIEIVYQTKKASASYLQRRLNIGYNRAARIVEEMEAMGIVGPQRGAKAREVIGIMSDINN